MVQFIFLGPEYDLQRDEYLYLNEGRHLAWGFLEMPPAISVQAWVVHALDNGRFRVRVWPAWGGSIPAGKG